MIFPKIAVYGLVDPRDKLLRYVGVTSIGRKRQSREVTARITRSKRAALQHEVIPAKPITRPTHWCRRISTAKGGRPFKSDTGRVFQTTGEAARAYDCWQANIVAVLKGRLLSTGGRRFTYL
jgi:hypothetical protein